MLLNHTHFKKILLLGFLSFFALGLFCLYFPPEFMTDSAHYFWGARSLLNGSGYQSYNPVAPGLVPIISWPPLFSSLIAFSQKIFFIHEINAFKVTNFLAFVTYGLSCSRLTQILFKTPRFKLLGLIFFSVPVVWQYLNLVMSEMLFMGLLMLALTLCLASLEAKTKPRRLSILFAAGFSVLLLGLTRYSGMVAVLPFGLFLLIAAEHPKKSFLKKTEELTVFLLPAALGLSLFLLRNKIQAGHFTYLEEHHKWPLQHQTISFVLSFAQGFFESIAGYSSTSLHGHPAVLIPPLAFIIVTGAVIKTLLQCKEPFLKDSRRTFILLSGIFITFYFGEMYIMKLKKGFGDSARYFHVIAPLIYLSCLLALEWLIEHKPSKPWASLKQALMISGLTAFLLTVFCFKSFDSLKSVVNTARRTAHPFANIFLTDFGQSPWIYKRVLREVSAEDLVISNNAAALGYIAGHQILEYRALHRSNLNIANKARIPDIISDRLQNGPGRVYVAIEKKYAFHPAGKPNWHEYLELYHYEVIQEDTNAILVRLQSTEPNKD